MNRRECYLRAIEFREPHRIPCNINLVPATWCKYKEKLEDIVKQHPFIFGSKYLEYMEKKNYCEFPPYLREGFFIDAWGCGWHNVVGGMLGIVVEYPLKRWDALKTYRVPDVNKDDNGFTIQWEKVRQVVEENRKKGDLDHQLGLNHGFMFQRLYYLRSFENLMIDFAVKDPKLKHLIDIVLERNMKLIYKWLEIRPDIIYFGDDLGMQDSLPISPVLWRKYIKPCYKKMFKIVRQQGVHVYFHTDGYILDVIPDLIECGISVLNPQSRSNGIDKIAKLCKEKVCVAIDLDRQEVLPHGNARDIRDHIKEAVVKLGSKKGGLILHAGVYPDVPLDNIKALCQAMEDYSTYYS